MSTSSSHHPAQASDSIPALPGMQVPPWGVLGITVVQWRTGLAAWLGWLFDGLDMHLYTLVAAPFVASLMQLAPSDPAVKWNSSLIQGAFLVGWAVGGSVFGRIGDLFGRSRALAMSILCYAGFTGLSFAAHSWQQLMIFRFVAALGIGGEWAVGASLLSETWPARWRCWIAATLQTAVNIGVLLASAVVFLLANHLRFVFLVGVLPALIVFWIRRSVPETHEWEEAKRQGKDGKAGPQPGLLDLFRPPVLRTTLLTIGVCSLSLTAWWGFMFWYLQHLRNLPDLLNWQPAQRDRLVSISFSVVIGISIGGNFFAAAVARRLGYRRSIALMCVAFFVTMSGTYCVERGYVAILLLTPAIGFCSGVFGLFTMYLPPLFPTLLRTTGAGFCYNVGRLASAAGTIIFGYYASQSGHNLLAGDGMRQALLCASFLFLPAAGLAMLLPDLVDKDA